MIALDGRNTILSGRLSVNPVTLVDHMPGIVLASFEAIILGYPLRKKRFMKTIYDRRSGKDRRTNNNKESYPLLDNNNDIVKENRRVFGDRRRTEGLEISSAHINDDEFDEVFKQFQKDESEELVEKENTSENLGIVDYQVLYREGVECAYITILQVDEQAEVEPTLYAFRDEEINGDSASESKPMQVQNIFGTDAYQCYVEQGWEDISKSENVFPWAIKAWLAQNMKQDTIKSR